MPTTIHPFPELRAYAESEARAYATTSDGQFHEGVFLYAVTRLTVMLCDLTRPASRDAVCRLVADTLMGGWTLARVHHAIAGHGLDWRALCARGLVPERCVCGPDEPTTAAESLALIVTHLWPSEP